MVERSLTLQGSKMLEGRAFGVTVWIPGRNVEIVQNSSPINQVFWNAYRVGEFLKQCRDYVPPCFLSVVKVKRLHRLLLRCAPSVAFGSCQRPVVQRPEQGDL